MDSDSQPPARRKPRKRRSFTPEFKAEAVRLCRVGDRSIAKVAKDLDLTESNLRDWVRQADIDAGNGPPGALTSEERAELTRLRREVKSQAEDLAILKKAARYFARESK
jgi:transposase